MSTFIFIIYSIISFILSLYGTFAAYYAYFKKKDEREKQIVLQSAGTTLLLSNVIFFIYYLLEFAISVTDLDQLKTFWNGVEFYTNNFSAGFATSFMMTIFGIIIFIRTKEEK